MERQRSLANGRMRVAPFQGFAKNKELGKVPLVRRGPEGKVPLVRRKDMDLSPLVPETGGNAGLLRQTVNISCSCEAGCRKMTSP